MLAGILSRRYFLTFLLLLATVALKAQFSYRFELLAGKSFFTQSDKINSSHDYIHFYEKTQREGMGTIMGIKYNLEESPVSLFLGYEKNKMSNYSLESNIGSSDHSQELQIESADLDIHYLFFKKSTFKPYVFAGVSVNTIDYSRESPSYYYAGINDGKYIKVDKITWEYESVQSEWNALGFTMGAGLNIKVSDKLGIFGHVKYRVIPQNQSEWLDRRMVLKTYSMGVYYRLLKRKNNSVL